APGSRSSCASSPFACWPRAPRAARTGRRARTPPATCGRGPGPSPRRRPARRRGRSRRRLSSELPGCAHGQLAQPAVVRAEVEPLAVRVGALAEAGRGRRALAAVHGTDGAHEQDPEAGVAQPPREVDLLVVELVALVQAADRVERRAPDEHAGAVQEADL